MVPVKVFNSIIILQSYNEVIRVTDIVFTRLLLFIVFVIFSAIS